MYIATVTVKKKKKQEERIKLQKLVFLVVCAAYSSYNSSSTYSLVVSEGYAAQALQGSPWIIVNK